MRDELKIGKYTIPIRIDPLMPDDQIRPEDRNGNEVGRITLTEVKYSRRVRDPLPPLTPRDEAAFRLATATIQRMLSAQMLGAPITRERARAEALAAMSEKDRALIAKDVTPNA